MSQEQNPAYLQAVDRLSKIVNAQIGRVESDPTVIVPVLMRLLCVNVVTETMHLPLSEVITNMQKSVKLGLTDARQKMDAVLAQEGRANDEAQGLVIGSSQAGQDDTGSGPSPSLRLVSDSGHTDGEPSGAHGGGADPGGEDSTGEAQ